MFTAMMTPYFLFPRFRFPSFQGRIRFLCFFPCFKAFPAFLSFPRVSISPFIFLRYVFSLQLLTIINLTKQTQLNNVYSLFHKKKEATTQRFLSCWQTCRNFLANPYRL